MVNPVAINRRVLRQILIEWKKSGSKALDRIVNSAFRENRLGSRDRRRNGDLLFLILKFFPGLLGMEWDPQEITDLRKLDELLNSLESSETPADYLLKNHENLKPTFAKDPRRHLRMAHGLPEFLLREIDDADLPAWHDYLHVSFDRAPVGLRVSEAVSPEELEPLGAVPSLWLKNAWNLAEHGPITDSELYLAGKLEIQDEHSQMIPKLLGVEPGMKILDLCAGAGGKTLQMADLMKGSGEIFVHDVSGRRIEELKKRARRHSLNNVRRFDPKLGSQRFDRILIDAPCSGLGTLRRTPERLFTLTEDECRSVEKSQKELLNQALQLAATDALLLYATCSVRPQENISHFKSMFLEPVNVVERFREQLRTENADQFLTLARLSPAHRISSLTENQNFAFQWGPSPRSQVSGALTGDAFFVAVVKCRNHEGKAARAF
jgi:16S rRNA (cytosine967-C5)-methyltransferase